MMVVAVSFMRTTSEQEVLRLVRKAPQWTSARSFFWSSSARFLVGVAMPRPIVMSMSSGAKTAAQLRLERSQARFSSDRLMASASKTTDGSATGAPEDAEAKRAADAKAAAEADARAQAKRRAEFLKAEEEKAAEEAKKAAEAKAAADAEARAEAIKRAEARKAEEAKAAEEAKEAAEAKAAAETEARAEAIKRVESRKRVAESEKAAQAEADESADAKTAATRALAQVVQLLKKGNADEAVAQGRAALEMLREAHGDESHAEVVQAKTLLGQALVKLGSSSAVAESEVVVREALEAHKAAGRHGQCVSVANVLSQVYRSMGQLGECETLLKDTVEQCRSADGAHGTTTLHFLFQLGNVLVSLEKLTEAEAALREAVEGLTQCVNSGAPSGHKLNLINAMGCLAMLLRRLDKEPEAETILVDALAMSRAALGSEHRTTLAIINNLGVVWQAQHKLSQTEELYREALALKRTVYGESHPSTLNTQHNLGCLLHELKKLDEAHTMLSTEVRERRAVHGNQDRDTLAALHALAKVELDRDEPRMAEPRMREVYETSTKVHGETDELALKAAKDLMLMLGRAGREEEAAPLKALLAKHAPADTAPAADVDEIAPPLTLQHIAVAKMWAAKLAQKQKQRNSKVVDALAELDIEAEAQSRHV